MNNACIINCAYIMNNACIINRACFNNCCFNNAGIMYSADNFTRHIYNAFFYDRYFDFSGNLCIGRRKLCDSRTNSDCCSRGYHGNSCGSGIADSTGDRCTHNVGYLSSCNGAYGTCERT